MATNKIKSPLFIFLILAIIVGAFLVAIPQQALAAQSDNGIALAQPSPPTSTASPMPSATLAPRPRLSVQRKSPRFNRSFLMRLRTQIGSSHVQKPGGLPTLKFEALLLGYRQLLPRPLISTRRLSMNIFLDDCSATVWLQLLTVRTMD